MTADPTYLSRYDHRVKLVHDVITSQSKLGDKAAAELAVVVLRTLDTIPEKLR